MTAQTSNVSIERVKALFDKEGWKYESAQQGPAIRSGFSGIGLEINVIEPNLNVVTTLAADSVKAEQFDEVLEWVENYNFDKAYPTVTAIKDENRGITALSAAYAVPGYWEYTDDQFAAQVRTGIQGVVVASRDFLAQFAPDVVQKINERA